MKQRAAGTENFVAGPANRVGGRELAALFRPALLALLVAAIASTRGAPLAKRAGERSLAVVCLLAAWHVEASERDVLWVDPLPSAVGSRLASVRALVRGRRPFERFDVFLVRARTSPEGSVLSLEGLYDLTRTSAASEDLLAAGHGHAAWVIGDDQGYYRVEVAELEGEPARRGEEWGRLAKIQHALTNLERVGQLAGVGRRSFKLDPAAVHVSLSVEADRLVVVADDHRIGIPWNRAKSIEGGRFIREEERELARPGNLVTWAVDRARDLSWFGDERMQLTKAVAYAVLDRLDRFASSVRAPDTTEPGAAELGQTLPAAQAVDPEIGFPPPPIPPLVTPGLADEGAWFSLENDPFVHGNAGAPPPLVTTYLRPDGARPDSRVIVVAWDPRQVELNAVPGTEEPQSATGETGTGMIPRKPEVMRRLLGAFNGGFQSTHGDFGMQVDGSVIVPPKPYAATVARTRDGATVFGTWPYDLTIPADFASFRQNLTPLVADGKLNPYDRQWWGGVPHDWEDETHTIRSGLCLTREGFILYFYGTHIDHTHLGRAMLAARCEYGIHLDMNQGHTGLELYRVFGAGELPPLPFKLDGHWQTEGDVLDLPGFRFRGRRLVRNLQLMHFPRYIRRGARDYFYLVLRPVVPGLPLVRGAKSGDEGAWTVTGLPQGGFPYALATTSLRPDPTRPETKVRVLELDPTTVRLGRATDPATETLVVLEGNVRSERSPGAGTEASLWLADRRASIAAAAPDPSAVRVAFGTRSSRGPVSAATCVDPDGMILYAEVTTAPDPSRDGALLDGLLRGARSCVPVFLASPLALALGGGRDLAGHPAVTRPSAVRLVRDRTPRARRVFQETPVLPPRDWMPLQRQTRWFPKEPEAAPSASADSPEP